MKPDHVRQLSAQLVIAASLCGGVYAFVAGPMRDRMLESEASLEAFVEEARVATTTLTSLPAILADADSTDRRIEEIEARNGPALDESALFAEVMRLADECAVQLEQLSPSGRPKPQAGRRTGPKAEADRAAHPGDRAARYTLTGAGAYADVARFVERLESPWAFGVVSRCRLSPAGLAPDTDADPARVAFDLTLDLYAFGTAPIEPDPPAHAEDSR
jgi:hypothetical protein